MKQVKKLLAIILSVATLIGVFSCGTSVFAEEYNEYVDSKAYEEKLLSESLENQKYK